MPLEILKYRQFSEEALGFDIVREGEYRTIESVKLRGENELKVIGCRKDNKLSYVYTILPLGVVSGKSKVAAYFKEETENRPLVIKPGEEVEIFVNERIGERKTTLMRYKLSHR